MMIMDLEFIRNSSNVEYLIMKIETIFVFYLFFWIDGD